MDLFMSEASEAEEQVINTWRHTDLLLCWVVKCATQIQKTHVKLQSEEYTLMQYYINYMLQSNVQCTMYNVTGYLEGPNSLNLFQKHLHCEK